MFYFITRNNINTIMRVISLLSWNNQKFYHETIFPLKSYGRFFFLIQIALKTIHESKINIRILIRFFSEIVFQTSVSIQLYGLRMFRYYWWWYIIDENLIKTNKPHENILQRWKLLNYLVFVLKENSLKCYYVQWKLNNFCIWWVFSIIIYYSSFQKQKNLLE